MPPDSWNLSWRFSLLGIRAFSKIMCWPWAGLFISLLLAADGTVTAPVSTAAFAGGGYSAVSVAFFFPFQLQRIVALICRRGAGGCRCANLGDRAPPPPALRTVTFVFSSNETGKPSELSPLIRFVLFSISS